MIFITNEPKDLVSVEFKLQEHTLFDGKKLTVGMKEISQEHLKVKEAFAKAAKELKKYDITEFNVDMSSFIETAGVDCVTDAVEGLLLAAYEQPRFPKKEEKSSNIYLMGIPENQAEEAIKQVEEITAVVQGVVFARDMVNLPGNKLRPEDFANQVTELLKGLPVEVSVMDVEELRAMKMGGLLTVGESSEYPPCLLVMRYLAQPESQEITGLVGKGVTCDTGGYCLKPAGSMLGIKGDMAGGAAVAGAIYGLAKNGIKTNVVGLIPMCENRIAPGSFLPGDVITAYNGKTIEIANTDAEGRLILADGVSYAVKQEGITRVLDIATLTGAVVNMLGFSIAGVISDNQELFADFKAAAECSGERYWRLPFYEEHEKMIESKIADIKNMGESCCGTITAGLFIRAFAEEIPWIHVDIAGTAWVDTPVFQFQSKGATGAGVTTLYRLCCPKG